MPSIVSAEQKFMKNSNVFDAQIRDEIVMVSLERDLYFSLDEIGARVWQILTEPRNLREICDILKTEYDVDIATAMEGVGLLLRDLLANGLILPSISERQASTI